MVIWIAHLEQIQMLLQNSFSSEDLINLKLKTAAWKQGYYSRYKNLTTFKYPNYETENWWPKIISFLGTPWLALH